MLIIDRILLDQEGSDDITKIIKYMEQSQTNDISKTMLLIDISQCDKSDQIFNSIITNHNIDLNDNHISEIIRAMTRKYSSPIYADTITAALEHPNSGKNTSFEFRTLMRTSMEHHKNNKNVLTAETIASSPKINKHLLRVSTRRTTAYEISALAVLTSIINENITEADTILRKIFKRLILQDLSNKEDTRDLSLRRGRIMTIKVQYLETELRKHLKTLHQQNRTISDETHNTIINLKAAIIIMSAWADYHSDSYSYFISPRIPTESTTDSLYKDNIESAEEMSILSNAPELPHEYQTELYKMHMKQAIGTSFINRIQEYTK